MAQPISFVTTEKERQILQYLFQVKVATFKQIHQSLFGPVVKSAVSKRIGRLLKAKLIHKGIVDFNKKYTQVFYLDSGTVDLLFDEDSDPIGRYQAQSGAVDHDLLLGDLRAKLCTFPKVKRYWTENELQCLKECTSDPRLRPCVILRSDAVLDLISDGKPFVMPLEFEASRKSNSRYEEKLRKYYALDIPRTALWISASSEIQNGVMTIDRNVRGENRPKFYYALLSDVLKAKDLIHFKNLQGDEFVLE